MAADCNEQFPLPQVLCHCHGVSFDAECVVRSAGDNGDIINIDGSELARRQEAIDE